MTSPTTAATVARWMCEKLNLDGGVLLQEEAVYEIENLFGEAFVYQNESGNPAIDRAVLTEFRHLTSDLVVWSRSQHLWRLRDVDDEPKSRSVR